MITLYEIISFIIIILFSVILSIQDKNAMSVSNFIQWGSIYSALFCHLFFGRETMWLFIFSSMIFGAFYYLVRKITQNKLGSADVCFGFFQGLFLKPVFLPVCLAIEAILALIFIGFRKRIERFAFIPFMSFALLISFLLQIVIQKYL